MAEYLRILTTNGTKTKAALQFASELPWEAQAVIRPAYSQLSCATKLIPNEWLEQNMIGRYAWGPGMRHLFLELESDCVMFKLLLGAT